MAAQIPISSHANDPYEASPSSEERHIAIEMLQHATLDFVAPPVEKSWSIVTQQPVSPHSSICTESQESFEKLHLPQQQPWSPSLVQAGPVAGLAAILFAFVQTFACYAVLRASDGDAVANWKYQPTVYLAVLTALSNKALAFAVVQGTVITFWLRVLNGTTLGQLHRDWGFGLYTYKSLMAGRHFNILALASISATFVAIDGPLLQRASSVDLRVPNQPVPLSVSLTPELPAYFTGVVDYEFLPNIEIQDFQQRFLPIFYDWAGQKPMKDVITGCHATCTATVRGPALAVDHCISENHYRNYSYPISQKEAQLFEEGCVKPSEDQLTFLQEFVALNGTTERLNYTTMISGSDVAETCAGQVNTTSCFLVSAIAEYDVTITEGVLTLDAAAYPKIVATANNTAITEDTIEQLGLSHGSGDKNYVKTTLSGIANAANLAFYQTEGLITFPDSNQLTLPGLAPAPGLYAYQHITNNDNMYGKGKDCAPAWKDPRQDVMASLNELMFRTGVYTAKQYSEPDLTALIDDGLDVHYNLTGRPTSQIELYHSNFAYFAGAAAVQLFTIVVALTTFHGWWRLGHSMSFSPLEIAMAFDAPLLHELGSNLNGRQIARLQDSRRVQYGVMGDETGVHGTEKMVIADTVNVRRPVAKMRTVMEHYCMVRSWVMRRFTWCQRRGGNS